MFKKVFFFYSLENSVLLKSYQTSMESLILSQILKAEKKQQNNFLFSLYLLKC